MARARECIRKAQIAELHRSPVAPGRQLRRRDAFDRLCRLSAHAARHVNKDVDSAVSGRRLDETLDAIGVRVAVELAKRRAQ